MTIALFDEHEAHMALRERLEAIAEIPPPADRAWTSLDFKPAIDRPHLESDFSPSTAKVVSFPVNHGTVEWTGDYVIRYYGLRGRGEAEIREVASAIRAAFPPGLAITLLSGASLYVRSDVAPICAQVMPVNASKAFCAIPVHWRAYSINSIPTA